MNTYEILEKLISFNTTTELDTLEAVQWIENYLTNSGWTVELLYSSDKKRASLLASSSQFQGKGVLFSGHLDVVPAINWDSNPFQLRQEQDKFFGRGTSDMKGAIAVVLALAPWIKQKNIPAYFCFSHDEEVGSKGLEMQVLPSPFFKNIQKNISGVFVMEATQNKLVFGHKSCVDGVVKFKGKTAHSSNPNLGINALKTAVDVYQSFYQLIQKIQRIFPKDLDFTVPQPVADINMFRGGEAVNQIPEFAEISFLGRFLNPEMDAFFLKEFQKVLNQFHTRVEIRMKQKAYLPSFNANESTEFCQKAMALFKINTPKKVSYGTEAGFFERQGLSTLVFGPGCIDQAHQKNEFIEKIELDLFEKNIKAFLEK